MQNALEEPLKRVIVNYSLHISRFGIDISPDNNRAKHVFHLVLCENKINLHQQEFPVWYYKAFGSL